MKFSVSVPAIDPSSPRLAQTLTSIYQQTALTNGSATAEIFIVTPNPEHLEAFPTPHCESESVRTHVISDDGNGLYAALSKSFELHAGDMHSYLGAGDTYEPQAFSVVSEILAGHQEPERVWLTGMIASRREDGALVRITLPARYLARGFDRGIYGRLAPSIQQESTWWGTALHKSIPLDEFGQLRLAGDYFLWKHFAQTCEPLVVECVLASFRWHGDNMSGDWAGYLAELNRLAPTLKRADRLKAALYGVQWALPNRWKVKFSHGRVLRWDWPDGPWA